MVSLSMGYPDHENLVELLRDRQTANPLERAKAVITKEEVVDLQDQVQKVYMADSILNYIATLAEATRNHPMITLGLSPRGTLALCRMTKAAAFMEERDYVIPEDVKKVFTDVTAHRMILDSRARFQEQSAKDILEEILKDTPAPKVEAACIWKIVLLGNRWSFHFRFPLKEEGKKTLTSREKASGAAVFTPPYTPGAPMISLVWQGRRGRLSCPPVRW